LDIIHSIIV